MSHTYDRRIFAYRDEFAALALKGKITVPTYAEPSIFHVCASIATLFASPRLTSERISEAHFGEMIDIFELHEGWAWGQLKSDSYVGYIQSECLTPGSNGATHKVSALRTFRYCNANIKSPASGWAGLNAPLQVKNHGGEFSQLQDDSFVYASHIVPIDGKASDFVAVAQKFSGTPYLWGGKSSLGLDCSALIQQSLHAIGIACPRDSDMIEYELRQDKKFNLATGKAQRGDLLFWSGHCALMVSESQMLHANAHHMLVTAEEAEPALARIAQQSGKTTSRLRPPPEWSGASG